MASSTQKYIIAAFVEILGERSMDKVTVIDITRRCGVNRNTFYYHFHDIYELLDLIFKNEIERLVGISQNEYPSWQESFCEGISWCMENSTAIYNIYRSSGRDRLEQYFIQAGKISAARYIHMKTQGREIGQQQVEDLGRLLGAAITGLVIEWVNGGMMGDPCAYIERVADLMDGCIEGAIKTTVD
jgi:AcrR family transcriptional regulator